MRLTTRSRYGTRMMLDIAMHCEDGPVRISDIAQRQGLSTKYLEKLIRELKKAGFISSKRGPGGGHTLAMTPKEISVGAIVRSLEGEAGLVECLASDNLCQRIEDCPTREVWIKASKAMYAALDEISISDMLKEGSFCVKTKPF
ncbi:Rrf2 family transcriptional regulator [Maridesulfovibrio ferrireducens]|uniref:RrF2 family transcriptional regulator n=1 Tax=Maridesulfovibrio ferrireducens TaxID=246191 RepID=UPI001A21584E|nr:Rrf2 family transcriptional regulator [Maridesulfovibrio ferrireducens]MBI9112626.1 Rrf2 family transcriptional regulator [Maridesulfovibrio ferrireducens]